MPVVRSTPVQGDARFDDLSAALRVDRHVLPPIARQQHKFRGKSRTFHVDLQALASGAADSRAADPACALGPASSDLVLLVGRELTNQIEIVAVAGATQLKFDLMLGAAARPVASVAADAFGRVGTGSHGAGARPAAGEIGEGSRGCRRERQRRENHRGTGERSEDKR